MTRFAIALTALIALAAPASAQRAEGPFTIEKSGRSYARLADAVAAIGDGAGTIRIAPGTYSDCAVQDGGIIAYVAAEPGTAIFDGGICEDKATLVLHGRGARVDGLVFQNLQVDDGNGAGIRIETGNLEVANSLFRNSEEGILSAGRCRLFDQRHAFDLFAARPLRPRPVMRAQHLYRRLRFAYRHPVAL